MMGVRAKSFVRNTVGSVAIMYALTAAPIVAVVGTAVDYSRAENTQTHLQRALDGAVLAAAGDSNRDAVALRYFNANFAGDDSTITGPTFKRNANGSLT